MQGDFHKKLTLHFLHYIVITKIILLIIINLAQKVPFPFSNVDQTSLYCLSWHQVYTENNIDKGCGEIFGSV